MMDCRVVICEAPVMSLSETDLRRLSMAIASSADGRRFCWMRTSSMVGSCEPPRPKTMMMDRGWTERHEWILSRSQSLVRLKLDVDSWRELLALACRRVDGGIETD